MSIFSHMDRRCHPPTEWGSFFLKRVLCYCLQDFLSSKSRCSELSYLTTLIAYPHYPVNLPGSSEVKNLPSNAGDARDSGLFPGSGYIPWRRQWQPTPVFLPGESHGQRSLVGYSPWSRRVGHDGATDHTPHPIELCIIRSKTSVQIH